MTCEIPTKQKGHDRQVSNLNIQRRKEKRREDAPKKSIGHVLNHTVEDAPCESDPELSDGGKMKVEIISSNILREGQLALTLHAATIGSEINKSAQHNEMIAQ